MCGETVPSFIKVVKAATSIRVVQSRSFLKQTAGLFAVCRVALGGTAVKEDVRQTGPTVGINYGQLDGGLLGSVAPERQKN